MKLNRFGVISEASDGSLLFERFGLEAEDDAFYLPLALIDASIERLERERKLVLEAKPEETSFSVGLDTGEGQDETVV